LRRVKLEERNERPSNPPDEPLQAPGRRNGDSEAVDSKEVERLNAEYTGSFARNPGQELGLLPLRYDDKTFGH
jgi:hypothetical protein